MYRAVAPLLAVCLLAGSGAHAPAGHVATGGHSLKSPAELPRVLLHTRYVPADGRSIAVRAGDDLQAALDRAKPGDQLVLQAGATFTGNFVLPRKTGDDTIVIRTSDMADLPRAGVRVSPAVAPAMPRIVSPNGFGAIDTADGAHDYRFVGIDFTVAKKVKENTGLVRLSDGDETARKQLSSRIVVDRCYVHGNPAQNDRRGVVLNGRAEAVVDSYVSQFHEVGYDSQAIAGWAGPGPFKIENCFLAGAAENLMFGGADPLIKGVIPSDIEIRHNTFTKPLTWRKGSPQYKGIPWSVKNLLELKAARRVLIVGNVFTHSWGDAQTGFAISVKTASTPAAPWVQTSDVTIRENDVRGAASAVEVEGRDPHTTRLTKRVAIIDNLFTDVSGSRWKGSGIFLQVTAGSRPPGGNLQGPTDIFVDHDTALQSGSVITVDGAPSPGFVFTDTITPHNRYGVKGSGSATGLATLQRYFPGCLFAKNVLLQGRAELYPPDNFFPNSMRGVGFVDLRGGNYRLADSSPYRHAGFGGKDIGADIDKIAAATGLPL
jgi:hypothetical protein